MPSIKKKNILTSEIYDNENENDAFDENNSNFLKDVFILDDFLNCEKTKYLLEQNYEHSLINFEDGLYTFFNKEILYCEENLEPYFSNKMVNFNKFYNIIRNNIKPKYNLDFFYENPNLAQPLIDKMDEFNEKRNKNKKVKIIENYEKKCKNKGKLFNWKTKKHY